MTFLASSIIHSNWFWHGLYWPLSSLFDHLIFFLLKLILPDPFWCPILILEHQKWVTLNKSVFTGLHWPSLAFTGLYLSYFIYVCDLSPPDHQIQARNWKFKKFEGFLMTVNVLAFPDLFVAFLWPLIVFPSNLILVYAYYTLKQYFKSQDHCKLFLLLLKWNRSVWSPSNVLPYYLK